ncbi:ferric enterobactin uptake receptor [Campylobacter sp. MIT 99-7217]|nr:ferric enterobactin uptake receptor [Campylobacter sp. MIT 99-7217]
MSSSYTLILVDGKRVNVSKGFDGNGFDSTSGSIPPASMIERVEVIRGPASIIYGSDAMGGVINIITKKNADKATGSISLETRLQEHGETWGNTYGFNGAIFAPLDDKITINIRGKYYYGERNTFYKKDIPGYNLNAESATAKRNPFTSHSPTGYKNASVGGRTTYKLNDENTFYADFEYNFQRLGSLNTSSNSITAIRDYDKYSFVLNHDGDYNFGKFNNYLQYNITNRIPHSSVPVGGSAGIPNRKALTENQVAAYGTTFTKNLDFGSYGSMILNLGPNFNYERLMKRDDAFDKDAWQIAVFGEGEYFINELVSTTLGVRVNKVETYGTYANPRAYVNFYVLEGLTIKAGLASGLQVPQLSTRYDGLYESSTDRNGNTTDYYGNTGLKPEQSLSYELGGILETPFANFSLTGFITDFTDAIGSRTYAQNQNLPNNYGICGSNQCSIYENISKARTQGVEFSLQSKALLSDFIPRGIFVDINYALTDTDQRSGDRKGKPLNNVPLHNLSGKISYKGESWGSYLRYVGKYKTPTFGSHTANVGPGRWYKDMHTVDLGADYRFKNGISISAVVNNLLDKDYVDYVVYQGTRGQSYTNNYQRMIPGRNFWLNIRADF